MYVKVKLFFSQALCEAVARTKIMNAEQVVRDEQGEEVRECDTNVRMYRMHTDF